MCLYYPKLRNSLTFYLFTDPPGQILMQALEIYKVIVVLLTPHVKLLEEAAIVKDGNSPDRVSGHVD